MAEERYGTAPLKCSHAIPYENASWCETFRNYEPSMKLPCGKCKDDHHTMICPKPTVMQVMAAGITEEETETIPDICGDGGVFDDINQQVMMVSTHELATKITEGSTSQDTQELGQYYIGNSKSQEYF